MDFYTKALIRNLIAEHFRCHKAWISKLLQSTKARDAAILKEDRHDPQRVFPYTTKAINCGHEKKSMTSGTKSSICKLIYKTSSKIPTKTQNQLKLQSISCCQTADLTQDGRFRHQNRHYKRRTGSDYYSDSQ